MPLPSCQKLVILIATLITLVPMATGQDESASLQIYLPQQAHVDSNVIRLGEVCILRGDDTMISQINDVTLGRIAMPGQTVTLDRPAMLSILAGNGIDTSLVSFRGAQQLRVMLKSENILSEQLLKVATDYITEQFKDTAVCKIEPAGDPSPVALNPEPEDLRLVPTFNANSSLNRATVTITVVADGQAIAKRDVMFSLKYMVRQPVAVADITQDQPITSDNVAIKESISNYPEPANWQSPFGLVARRDIKTDETIKTTMLKPLTPEVVVKRNQSVLIKCEKPGLIITAVGIALEKGATGECIRVRNTDSKRIILAQINEDGTVAPVR